MRDKRPVWEASFRLKGGVIMTCLMEDGSGGKAYEQIMSA